MDTIARIKADLAHEEACFLTCQMKNLALANGTYRAPWWAQPLPQRIQAIMRGPGRRKSLTWLYA